MASIALVSGEAFTIILKSDSFAFGIHYMDYTTARIMVKNRPGVFKFGTVVAAVFVGVCKSELPR